MILIKWNIVLLVLLSLFLVCCNQRESTSREEKARYGKSCYSFIQKQDTINLLISLNEGKVEGVLEFRFYEKDQSTGAIEGEMRGDTLFAVYQFMSEGILSLREVAFLQKDTAFLMGIGEVTNAGNKEVFKNRKDISFPAALVLQQVPCDDF
jgi:hypothetical protein